MPVYHFIYHAYRSWNADHPEGWYQRGEKGRQRTQPRLGAYRNNSAEQEPMEFCEQRQKSLLAFLTEICERRGWRVHCVGMDTTHIHTVVSWEDGRESNYVKSRLKNLLSLLLNKHESKVGRRVFSEGSGDRRVRDMAHLSFLKKEYLPKKGGLYWCEEENAG